MMNIKSNIKHLRLLIRWVNMNQIHELLWATNINMENILLIFGKSYYKSIICKSWLIIAALNYSFCWLFIALMLLIFWVSFWVV